MPALDALLDRFAAANTQPLGVSVDSQHCHAGWGVSLGGISFPLLADFHPKGKLAEDCGLYLADKGITDRATVIIDAGGKVQHASAVGPGGERDIGELAALCEKVNADHEGSLLAADKPAGLQGDHEIFVKSGCGFSRSVLWARDNLHLDIPVRNVSEDSAAMAALEKATGKKQVPCLMKGGEAMLESQEIIAYLVKATTGL